MNDDKDYLDYDQLVKEIQKEEPDYIPPEIPEMPENIINFNDVDISKIIPLSLHDFEKYEIKQTEYVICPFLETQGICLVYAAAGVGKTLFTLNLAYSIASGGNFLKYSCPKPRKVLYIDGEMKFSQIASRIKNIIKTQGESYFKENLCVLTPDELQKIGYRMFKIDDPNGQNIYDKIIDKYNFEVIIIDNFSVLTDIDENKSNEWAGVLNWILSLRAKGKSVIAVHHAGKEKNGYRGSSCLLDFVDTAISLQAVNDDNIENNNNYAKKFKIVYQKTRGFGGEEAESFEVTLENEKFSYRSIEMSTLDKVIDCLNSNMSQRDIARELLISQTSVHRLIKKARLTGRVKV